MRRISCVPFALLLAWSCGTEPPPVELPPPIEFDPPGPKDPELAARAAALLGSCLSDGKGYYAPQQVLGLMYYNVRASFRSLNALENVTRCLAASADGCGALDRCFASTAYVDDACEPWACLPGDVATLCMDPDAGIELRTECGRLGMTCVQGGCSPEPAGEPCDPANFDPCKDGTPYKCSPEGVASRKLHCADYGLECGLLMDGSQTPVCTGTGAVCDSFSPWPSDIEYALLQGCEGSTARACYNDREFVFDCEELAEGFTCQSQVQGAGSVTRFCGLASECSWGHAEFCEGDSLVLCNGGRLDKIDCTSLGFQGCDAERGICYPSPRE